MDYRTSRALDRLHERDPDMAHIFTELLLRTATEQKTPSPVMSSIGENLARLMQWPMPLYLISAGLLAANYKIPEVAELIKAFAGLQ